MRFFFSMPTGDIVGKKVTLNSGRLMPLLGFGTYQIPENELGLDAVLEAIRFGYDLLDCASFYQNEKLIGLALKKVDRKSIFVVSKVWNDAIFAGPKAVRESCLQSVSDLQCEYLDLYLIHWPVPGKHVEAYKELVKLQQEGLVRDIGISNYTIEDYEELSASGINVVPVVNQIEINPFLNRKSTLGYFKNRGILPMSFRGLRNATAFDDPTLTRIAAELGVSTAQILGRWLVQKGICHIPKSLQRTRIHRNADIFGFTLSEEHMHALDQLTTAKNMEIFREHYLSRITRDTPISGYQDKVVTID